jgi:hypothetical protein
MTSYLSTHNLSDRMESALTAAADVGTGASMQRQTAKALVTRGLVEVVGEGIMSPGVTVRLTAAGWETIQSIIRDQKRARETYGLSTRWHDRLLAKAAKQLEA